MSGRYQRVRFAPRATADVQGGYASASDGNLVRARLRWEPAPRARTMRVTFCGAE